MKNTTIFLIFIAFFFNAICQNDTSFYYKNNEIKVIDKNGSLEVSIKSNNNTAEDKLFEGDYEPEKMTAEEKLFKGDYEAKKGVYPVFCFSNFTSIYANRKFEVHGSGVFAGFSNLASRDLSQIGASEHAKLKLSSYEIGLTLCGLDAQLSRKYGWLFFSGLGFKVQQYNADQNNAFVVVENNTVQQKPDGERLYSKSRLVQWYLHAPIILEYQIISSRGNSFFIQAGVELGLKLSSRSTVVYRDCCNKKVKSCLGKGMNVNPLTADIKAEIGFNDFALYARYGLIELFRKHRGPVVVPVAAGVIWHF